MDRFYQMLANEPARAFYGERHVTMAGERGAVETLMVTDELFRYGWRFSGSFTGPAGCSIRRHPGRQTSEREESISR